MYEFLFPFKIFPYFQFMPYQKNGIDSSFFFFFRQRVFATCTWLIFYFFYIPPKVTRNIFKCSEFIRIRNLLVILFFTKLSERILVNNQIKNV